MIDFGIIISQSIDLYEKLDRERIEYKNYSDDNQNKKSKKKDKKKDKKKLDYQIKNFNFVNQIKLKLA